MNPLPIVAGILVVATLAGLWRTLRRDGRWRAWRCIGQLLAAGALWLLLSPPSLPQARVSAIVLTPGVDDAAIAARPQDTLTLALPGVAVGEDRSIERVPDLGTGLRRHPQIGELRILGDGLDARDRDLPEGIGIVFEPGAPPVGVVALEAPASVEAGAHWAIRGRLAGVDKATLEVRDPGDAVLAMTTAAEDGQFALPMVAKFAGQQDFRLRVLDADATVIEEIPVALFVREGDSLRSAIVAGAADAELKYLRRWALDSGQRLSSRIALSRGIAQRQQAPELDAASLAATDLLVIDERAWAGLSTREKSALMTAIDGGLGVLLRVTGPLPASVAADWARLGLALESSDRDRSVELARLPQAGPSQTSLTRWPMSVDGARSATLALAADGSDLGRWTTHGQGRVGVWLLLDSYRLQLSGESARYGTLWSDVFSTLARAGGVAGPELPDRARVDRRSVICAISSTARIKDAEGGEIGLLPEAGEHPCAAWWPKRPGWHTLIDGDARWPIFVLAADQGRALLRSEIREATTGLVRQAAPLPDVDVTVPRGPLFLIWLLLASGLWWLERRAAPMR
ncbi:hypothetical protein [Dokdonella immobilis]|uniref:Carboxypeptidase regulatory-like domain-containing protein n=1 Tax=Dokdonella immobilis TaxID=578942 RepID=A0A1I5AU73_9GAMM|nr:hypothetical protein [Dokdonella immobilis]SFN66008.1 hypothetical protein SAMN05216289_14313 [Dokdonella immobilis]